MESIAAQMLWLVCHALNLVNSGSPRILARRLHTGYRPPSFDVPASAAVALQQSSPLVQQQPAVICVTTTIWLLLQKESP